MNVISEQIDIAIRMIVPYIIMAALFLLSMISFSTPLSTTIEIPFVIIIIYHWAIYRPSIIPPLLVFAVGICIDFLSGFPAGLSAFVLLVILHIVVQQRLFLTGQPFMVIWFGFVLASMAALFVQWFLFGLIHFQWTPLLPVILAAISGSLLFPVISLILNLSHKMLPLLPDQYSAVK